MISFPKHMVAYPVWHGQTAHSLQTRITKKPTNEKLHSPTFWYSGRENPYGALRERTRSGTARRRILSRSADQH